MNEVAGPELGPQIRMDVRRLAEALLADDGFDKGDRIFEMLREFEEAAIEVAIKRRVYAGAPNYPHIMVRAFPGARTPARWSPEHEQLPVSCRECGANWTPEELDRNCPARLPKIYT